MSAPPPILLYFPRKFSCGVSVLTRAFILFLFTVLAFGCATPTPTENDDETIESMLADPNFQKENLPIRTLTVIVVASDYYPEEDVRDAIATASRRLREQVGVELKVLRFEQRDWSMRTFLGVHRELAGIRRQYPDADIVLGYFKYDRYEDACDVAKNLCIIGMTMEARNIAMTTYDYDVLVHEFGHVLMPFEPHAKSGVMTANKSDYRHSTYFTVRNRRIILGNKYRDFASHLDGIAPSHDFPH